MELTPDSILDDYNKKKIDKHIAAEQLIALIENSNFLSVRLDCIDALGTLGIKNKKVFTLLENLLISDSNESIRNVAAIGLKINYLDKAFSPMKWALLHDNSPYALNTIIESLVYIIRSLQTNPNPSTREELLEEIEKIDEKDIRIAFEIQRATKPINDFTNENLADILINYFILLYLKKTFWRLKYVIEGTNIVELDFIFKSLTSVPIPIKYLTSLKTLILRYNQILKLPEWIGDLTNLESLNLNVNNLTELPESIGNLSSLKELSFWKNELIRLPESIGSLSSLITLNLRLNRLISLPSRIGELKNLKELNLHDNKLITLPDSIGLLSSLEKLNLSWNQLISVPISIGNLTSLKFLDLGKNELSQIPDSISYLNNLEILNLSENKISEIPASLGQLSSLQTLNLSRNRLTELPETLGKLCSLKDLYIGENINIKIPKTLQILIEKGLKIYT